MRKRTLFSQAAFVLIAALQVGCISQHQVEFSAVPRQIRSDLLSSGSLFGIRRFVLRDPEFFQGRLFAASDRGLFEIVDGKLSSRFNWFDKNDVVEELFSDKVHNYLWLRHPGFGKFLRFDGKSWTAVPLPEISATRGESLAGFTMFSSGSGLYVHSTGAIWEWEDQMGRWRPVSLPKRNCSGERPGEPVVCFVGAAATEDILFAVFRQGTTARLEAVLPEEQSNELSDYIIYSDGNSWTKIPDSHEKFFFIKEIVGGSDAVFILTTKNDLFSVKPQGLTELPSPGEVETIASTSAGNLLVSVRNVGIFEYTTKWEQRAEMQLNTADRYAIVNLTENRGKIAYTISYTKSPAPEEWNLNGQASLWVIEDGNVQCVRP